MDGITFCNRYRSQVMFSYRMGSLRHFNSLTLGLERRVKHCITQLNACKTCVSVVNE